MKRAIKIFSCVSETGQDEREISTILGEEIISWQNGRDINIVSATTSVSTAIGVMDDGSGDYIIITSAVCTIVYEHG